MLQGITPSRQHPISRIIMDIRHLKIFTSVYRHRSFTRASEELLISQPTISEHIKNLENSLGCRLFDRLGRSIMPTAEAEILYPKALQLLDDIKRTREEITAVGTGMKGTLIIGASTIPGTYILPRAAYSFKKQFPEVAFEIRITDSAAIISMVMQHDILCGIVGAQTETAQLVFEPLVEDELVLVATAKVLPDKTVTIGKLAATPFLNREKGSGTRRAFEGFLEKQGVSTDTFNIVATLGSTGAVKEAAKEGLGAAVISRTAVQEELDSGKLHEIPIGDMKMKRNFYLVRHAKRTLPPQYLAFCNYLKKSGAGHGAA